MNRKKESRPKPLELAKQDVRAVTNKVWSDRHRQDAAYPAVELAQAVDIVAESSRYETLNPSPSNERAVVELEQAAKQARVEHEAWKKRQASEKVAQS